MYSPFLTALFDYVEDFFSKIGRSRHDIFGYSLRWKRNCDLQFEILRLLAFSLPHIHYHKLEILHLLLEQREQYASCAGGRCYTIQLHLLLQLHLRQDPPVTVRFSTQSALQETIQNRKTQCRLEMQTQNFDTRFKDSW